MKWWTIIWSSCRVFAKPYNLLLLATLALTFFLYHQVAEHLQNGKIAHVFSFYFLAVDLVERDESGSSKIPFILGRCLYLVICITFSFVIIASITYGRENHVIEKK